MLTIDMLAEIGSNVGLIEPLELDGLRRGFRNRRGLRSACGNHQRNYEDRGEQHRREQDERRRTRARVARSGSVEVISKVERTAVRRSLHRLVRRSVAVKA